MTTPITFRRVGETLVPRQKWQFDRTFAEGHDYTLVEHEERSSPSHAHYFATVNEAWKTLPENQSKRWSDATHMRKWFLIKTGWSIDRIIVAETDHGAKEIAALAGQLDHSAVIMIQGNVVTVSVARSQKTGKNGMNKEDFQKSKSDVLGELAILLGVDVATLSSQVSDSPDAQQQASRDLENTPAAARPPSSEAAGVTNSEVSALSDDWLDTYVIALSGVRDKAASLQTRHSEALQMLGGKPNSRELDLMRRVWRLVQQRNQAIINPAEYEAGIAKLKAMPERDAA